MWAKTLRHLRFKCWIYHAIPARKLSSGSQAHRSWQNSTINWMSRSSSTSFRNKDMNLILTCTVSRVSHKKCVIHYSLYKTLSWQQGYCSSTRKIDCFHKISLHPVSIPQNPRFWSRWVIHRTELSLYIFWARWLAAVYKTLDRTVTVRSRLGTDFSIDTYRTDVSSSCAG